MATDSVSAQVADIMSLLDQEMIHMRNVEKFLREKGYWMANSITLIIESLQKIRAAVSNISAASTNMEPPCKSPNIVIETDGFALKSYGTEISEDFRGSVRVKVLDCLDHTYMVAVKSSS